jgi:hypothetical protein
LKTEQLWPCPREVEVSGQFDYPAEAMLIGLECPEHLRNDLQTIGRLTISEDPSAYKIELKIDSSAGKPEGYILDMNPGGTQITGTDKAGLFYGIQTFLQVLAMCVPTGKLTELNITDSPAYKKRSFMIDMGRSAYQMDMIKRVIRILARLKMNQLHMHLYDDELCGIKFDGLPFGTDNPYAISIKEFGEIVRYAADYHVEIVPELEAWGHVSSIVYHKKHLRGGEGTCDGSSFLFCEETFELMTEMIRQVIEVMPQKGVIHLGLDEAKWFVADDMPKDYTPSDMMARFYQIVQDIAKKDGKEIMLRFWADHIHRGGRPVPQEIQHNSIIEPWQYWQCNNDRIDTAIEKYSGKGKMRWMMGAGQSAGQTRGAYHATRHWCKQAIDSPNVEGVNITYWWWNQLENQLVSLFAGAHYAWNPMAETRFDQAGDYEEFDQIVFPIMRTWQTRFRDAFPDDIARDRGPLVFGGFYLWGDKHGTPVSPTTPYANTQAGHDYLNE